MTVFYGQFTLCVTLKAPFLIAGTTPLKYGVDIAQIQNHRGCAVIPDSHIKGVLRHVWQYRGGGSTGVSAETLFGNGGADIDSCGGRIWFTDLVAQDAEDAAKITRMAIDPATGAAKRGSLFVIEQIARPGATVRFKGEVTIRSATQADAQAIVDELQAALVFVSSIGKFKTAGFGRLHDYDVAGLREITPPVAAKSFQPGQYELVFLVNKPLLVDTTRPDGNMFSGSQVITGGTIKGALAAKLTAAGYDPKTGGLGDVLSKMTISHAFPGYADARDLALDHVQVHGGKRRLNPKERIDCSDEKAIPVFAPDFKDDTEKLKEPQPRRREYRTHVKIEAQTGSAMESALFSTSAILHEYAGHPVTWRANVEFSDSANAKQQEMYDLCMNELEHGLFTLGKTKARTERTTISPAPAGFPSQKTGDWRLVLDTPLLMLREYHLSNERLYWAAIGKYWRQATNGCYELTYIDGLPEIYAQQSFSSGYQSLKFKFHGADRVEPFVLTNPGSVFCLTCIDPAKAGDVRGRLEQTGLSVAKWTLPDPLNREGDAPGTLVCDEQPGFGLCPFGPQNGYGHIRMEDAT